MTIAWGAISRRAPLHEDDYDCVYVLQCLGEADVVATSFA